MRPKPFVVLCYLVEHAGRLVTKEELRKAVWQHAFISEGVLKGYIRDLRHVLGDDPEAPRFIETVARRGYRFVASVRQAAPGHLSLSSPSTCVGREQEVARLQEHLARALRGQRQIVFVTGEPGIGKTTLVETFLDRLGGHSEVWLGRGQCIEHHGAGEAYMPVLEALDRLCRAPDGEHLITLLYHHAPTWLVQLPALLADAELEAVQRKVQGATRERMLREMAEALEVISASRGLILVLEDLHWSDPSTLDLLAYVAQRRGTARLLVIGTYRPAEVIVSGHPLRAVKQDLQGRGLSAELALGMLPPAAVSQYLAARFPHNQFPLALSQFLYRSTEGNPFFIVNVVDYLVAQGLVAQVEEHWQLQAAPEDLTVSIPESLRQLITKQFERLLQEEQRVLEVASVAGADFSALAVAAGVEAGIEQIEVWCEGLVHRGQFLCANGTETVPDGTLTGRYGFLHALYQNVVYERVGAIQRIRLHRRIGERIEEVYGTRAKEMAAELAVHFEQGQDYWRAVQYLERATQRAIQRSAYQEAIQHLTKALELLKTLPDTPERTQQELTLQVALGVSLTAIKSWAAPEVERAYARAQELCHQVGETPQLFPVLGGLSSFYFTRAEYKMALELGERLLSLAQSGQSSAFLLAAHYEIGTTLSHLGEFAAARVHLEQGIAPYEPQEHSSLGVLYGSFDREVSCLTFLSLIFWFLGYPDEALKRSHEAVALAQELSHPFNLALALDWAARLHQFRREGQAAQERAEAAVALSTEQGFPFWLAWGIIVRGWALAEQGQTEGVIAQMQQSLTVWRATGAEELRPHFLALLAEAHGEVGQAEEGLSALYEALTLVNKTGERFYEAELYRLKGQLTLQTSQVSGSKFQVRPNQKAQGKSRRSLLPNTQHLIPSTALEAEACFLQALEIARRQQAKSLELRAVVSLSRLWQQQGKNKEAQQMLEEIYNWFSEGFETADLREAKALLEELAR